MGEIVFNWKCDGHEGLVSPIKVGGKPYTVEVGLLHRNAGYCNSYTVFILDGGGGLYKDGENLLATDAKKLTARVEEWVRRELGISG